MEDYKKYIIMALIYLAVIFAVYFLYETLQRRRAAAVNKSSHINRRGRNKLYFFYRLFRNTPGIRKTFSKVIANTESIYPSDQMSINKEATKIMLKSVGFAGAIMAASTALSRGDLWYLLMGALT